MSCLTCAFFDATEPPEHKAAREAGQCEYHCSKEWDWHGAFRFVQNHSENLYGFCRLHPEGKQFACWHYCGQHKPVLDGDNGWGVTAFGASTSDRSLRQWANQQYLLIKNGGKKSYVQQQNEWLEARNKELQAQLAAARKRSAARFARLQKVQAKAQQPKHDENKPEPIPPALRLVAAE